MNIEELEFWSSYYLCFVILTFSSVEFVLIRWYPLCWLVIKLLILSDTYYFFYLLIFYRICLHFPLNFPPSFPIFFFYFFFFSFVFSPLFLRSANLDNLLIVSPQTCSILNMDKITRLPVLPSSSAILRNTTKFSSSKWSALQMHDLNDARDIAR